MNSWKTAAFVTALFLAGFAAAAQAQVANNNQAEVLLQEARHKALVDGDLERTIELCKKILAEHNGNRAAAAKALMQMGQCYEKLGRAEARKAYERVVSDFADQHDVVTEARMRLAVMESDNGKSEVTVRQVWAPSREPVLSDTSGAPSPDGHYLSFTNWSHGNLAIRNLATGEYRDLTDEGNWSLAEQFASRSIWSPNGKQIVYAWQNAGLWELRIVGLDGSKPRTLYSAKEKNFDGRVNDSIEPFAWSGDGKYILATFEKKAGTNERTREIALVGIVDGSVHVLKSFKGLLRNHHEWMSLSPDGRYVVYARPTQEDGEQRDIFLLATDDSGKEVLLVKHPADDYGPAWAPDGKTIVFVSDRSGSYDAWFIQVADGELAGEPQIARRDVGEIKPMGFTQQGSLYYGLSATSSDVYVASIDPETGKLLAPPAKLIRKFEGYNRSPCWSPDGKRLAYVSSRPSPDPMLRRVLVIRSLETGQERELYPEPELKFRMMVGGINWSPDGRWLLCRETLDLIDVQTGDVTRLVQFDPGKVIIVDAEWSPDGKTIFYYRIETVSGDTTKFTNEILAHDLGTGKEKKLLEGRVSWPGLGVSPDGRKLAFSSGRTLRVIPTEGGEQRILHRLSSQQQDGNRTLFAGKFPPAWTTDGRYVLFGTRNPNELWRIPAEGGEAQKLLAMEGGLRFITVHPDGRRIAFTNREWISQVWAIENFLPKSTTGD